MFTREEQPFMRDLRYFAERMCQLIDNANNFISKQDDTGRLLAEKFSLIKHKESLAALLKIVTELRSAGQVVFPYTFSHNGREKTIDDKKTFMRAIVGEINYFEQFLSGYQIVFGKKDNNKAQVYTSSSSDSVTHLFCKKIPLGITSLESSMDCSHEADDAKSDNSLSQ